MSQNLESKCDTGKPTLTLKATLLCTRIEINLISIRIIIRLLEIWLNRSIVLKTCRITSVDLQAAKAILLGKAKL